MSRIRRILPIAWPLLTALAPLVLIGLYFASCSGGGGSSPTAPNSTITVQVMDNSFSPKDVTINPGDTVQWVMAGSAPLHTVTDNGGAFDSGISLNAKGIMFSHTFNAPNVTYNYHCKVHFACCGMAGSVTVGKGPPPNPGY
jgi:plastocyanin